MAALTYVYDQGTRDLHRGGNAFRDHHDLSIATTRVALDHDSCLEVALLRGSIAQVEGFAQRIIAERGVRHGRVRGHPGRDRQRAPRPRPRAVQARAL